MKINTIVRLSLAILFLFSVAVGSALATPNSEPPQGNVSPNFSALTVQGDAGFGKVITATIAAPDSGVVTIDKAKINKLDVLNLKNDLGGESAGYPMVIDDGLTVVKDLNIKGGSINLETGSALRNPTADPSCLPWQPCAEYTVDIKDDLRVTENIYAGGSLEVSGKIKAGGAVEAQSLSLKGALSAGSIGRFYNVKQTASSSGNDVSAVAFCDNGDFRLSCSGLLANSYSNVFFRGAEPWGGESCYSSALNQSGRPATLYVYAYCFSPNG